jgi:hypothetical protein
MSMRVSREKVENTIKGSKRTFKSLSVRYFKRTDEIVYTNLNQVDWQNVQRAAVNYHEAEIKHIEGETVRSTRRRVR